MNFYDESKNDFWEISENDESITNETTGNNSPRQRFISRQMTEQQAAPFNFDWPPNTWKQEVPTIKEMSEAIKQRFSFPMTGQDHSTGKSNTIWGTPQQYKYTTPQQPLVMPKDNTAVSSPYIPPIPQTRTLSGYFDGNRFTIKGRTPYMIYSESYPAVSGKPNENGNFDYSIERQRIPDVGPIPEGSYWINPQEIMWIKDAGKLDEIKRVFNRGSFRGGERAWGKGKIEINPKQVNLDNNVKRGNFTIHGGESRGSRGCIDLTKYEEQLFNFLEKYRGDQDSIPIFVKYPPKNRK